MGKTKKTGLGADVYFPNDIQEPEVISAGSSNHLQIQQKGKKIRRTFVINEHTQKDIERLRLDALIRGEKITLSELLDEAIELLMEKKRGGELSNQ